MNVHDNTNIDRSMVAEKAFAICETMEKNILFLWSLFKDEFEKLQEIKENRKQQMKCDCLPF
jgi:hypothetical protein